MGLADRDFVALMQWACPRLGLRWDGFRRVRHQVRKRVARRLDALGLSGAADYRRRLEADPTEWAHLEAAARVTITRFYRDRGVWDALRDRYLPLLLERASAEGRALRCWSAGCCSGEEPYTLALMFERIAGPTSFEIIATDADEPLLERARRGCYPPGTLRELPREWVEASFRREGAALCLSEPVRARVQFTLQDLRREMPTGRFDVILCRNLLFTYFAPEVQAELAPVLIDRLTDGGVLVIGAHEEPRTELSSIAKPESHPIYVKR